MPVTPSPNKRPRQSSPNLLWHRSAKQQAALGPKKSRDKHCPGIFPRRIPNAFFHSFHILHIFKLHSPHFFRMHFQNTCFHVFSRCIFKMHLSNFSHCPKTVTYTHTYIHTYRHEYVSGFVIDMFLVWAAIFSDGYQG